MNVPTSFWTRLSDGRVRCDVCPRECKMHEGQRGFCHVRLVEEGEVKLATWGRSSGFCVDPIEKKPLYHFLPGTPVLSFGTAGCNLGCRFCQNSDISKSREMDTLAEEAAPDAVARAAVETGCRSVAFTYNDPVIFLEYVADVAEACRARGIRTVAVTAGYVSTGAREELFRHVDAANVDLKAFTEEFYREQAAGELAPVLDTLRHVACETDVWLETTTLLIPGLNDGEVELDAMTRWVVDELGPDVPMHFSAFHPAWKLLDRPPTPPEILARACAIAHANGVRHAYTGNVQDPARGRTRCAACDALLVARDGYELVEWRLAAGGTCPRCGAECPGVFEDRPGHWGSRRRPVRMEPFA